MPWLPLEIEIVEIQGTGQCSRGHKVGDTFNSPEEQKEICAAAFHTLYPYILALRTGGSFPWADDPDTVKVGCPDFNSVVVFKISRLTE